MKRTVEKPQKRPSISLKRYASLILRLPVLRSLVRRYISPFLVLVLRLYFRCFNLGHFQKTSSHGNFKNGPARPANRLHDPPSFRIDAVYTWVDGSDPQWATEKEYWLEQVESSNSVPYSSSSRSRFESRDLLKYSIRSIEQHADYIHRIFVVTNGQIPHWLNLEKERIQIIPHSTIFDSTNYLPTFNSSAIETCLHNIPGLSEHFLYFNDDVFLGRHSEHTDYFTPDGRSVSYLSRKKITEGPLDPINQSGLDWCIMNSRRLLNSSEGQHMNKMLHTPHALRKSVLENIFNLYRDDLLNTQSNRFRSTTDIGLTNSLYQYYAKENDLGLLSTMTNSSYANRYINLGNPFLAPLLTYISNQRIYDSFCLNEPFTPLPEDELESVYEVVTKFLEDYFPKQSEFEK